jgi:hypothetical protein
MGRMSGSPFRTREFSWAGYRTLKIDAVPTGVDRIVPPAGDAHAFEVQRYRRRVEISVSPAGRSVRVWVDGVEVRP